MNLFGLKKTIKLGVKSLWLHRLRSILTTLGIVFGVCSVIAMLAIGEGASRETQAAIAKLGSTNLIIETVKPPDNMSDTQQADGASKYGLTYADAEAIRYTIDCVEVVVPVRQIEQEARYSRRKAAIKIIGTVPWYTEVAPIRIIRGRFLSSIDLKHQQNVCVLDESLAQNLFAFEYPLGKEIKIQGSYYRVVGVAASVASLEEQHGLGSSGQSVSNSSGGVAGNVYIPVTTARTRFIEISYEFSGGGRSLERVELQKIIVKAGSMEDVLGVRNVLDALLGRLHEKQDYNIVVPLELLRHAARNQWIFSVVLGSIAAISLLVGGIGIMNIMLASVSERTREIGIRRALGAKKSDIIWQFLTETVVLTLVGGTLGVILGSIIPFLVTYFVEMPTAITGWSLFLSFGISAAVGITFGLYPAYRAANMDPIESLRHE